MEKKEEKKRQSADCENCQYYDVLQRSGNKNCLCTGLIFDPAPTPRVWKRKKSSSLSPVDLTRPTL